MDEEAAFELHATVTGTSCCWESPDATVSIRLLTIVPLASHATPTDTAFVRSMLRALPKEGATPKWQCFVASPAQANLLAAVVCAPGEVRSVMLPTALPGY